MISRIDKRFKLLIFFMAAVLLLTSVFSMFLDFERVNADNWITIYLDMGYVSDSNTYGWSKQPSKIYYVLSNEDDTSVHATESLTFDSSNYLEETSFSTANSGGVGKVFKLRFDASQYSKISFSPYFGSQSGRYRTARRNDSKLNFHDKMRLYVTNDDWNGYQGIWATDDDVDTTEDYATKTFKIANLTSTRLPFKIVFSNTAGDELTVDKKNNTQWVESGKTLESVGRNVTTGVLEPVQITIPTAGAHGAYTKVEFYQNDIMFKDYSLTLAKHDIVGETFYYGWTQYRSEHTAAAGYTDPLDYGNLKVRCFRDDDYDATNYTARTSSNKTVLYFDKNGFPLTNDSDTIKVIRTNGDVYTTTKLTKGNASCVTSGKQGSTTDKGEVELNEGEVFTIEYTHGEETDYYNAVWDSESSNMVVVSTGKAQVNGTFSLQTMGVMESGQKYITVKSNMYDYQYDQFGYDVQYQYREDHQWKVSTVTDQPSRQGAAKRPYLAINEAISAYTNYSKGAGNYPLYMGQFWLPLFEEGYEEGGNKLWDTSSEMYSTTTASMQRAGYNKYRKEASGDSGSGDKYYIAGSQYAGNNYNDYYEYFGFGNTLNNFRWSANLAFRTDTQKSGTHMPYDAVVQGLVNDKLVNGKLAAVNGTAIPYFDTSWWTGTFDTSQGETINKADYIDKYEDLDFPFFEIEEKDITFENGYTKDHMLTNNDAAYDGTYYVFDSKKYSVRASKSNGITKLSKSNKKFAYNNDSDMVYDNYGDGSSGSQSIGFFPFNGSGDGGNAQYLSSSNLHYGFGVEYDIEFFLNENGTVDGTENGVPITFTFQGDDDVWVYLDDQLILDMGGAHKNAIGEINFKNEKTFISAVANVSNASVVSNNSTSSTTDDGTIKRSSTYTLKNFSNAVKNKATVGKHTIRMFYLERGMLNSNLYVMFNLPMALTKYDLQVDTDFSSVNPNFLAATKAAADSDVFNFEVSNRGTTNVVGSGYYTPTLEAVNRSFDETSLSSGTTLSNDPGGLTVTLDTTGVNSPSSRVLTAWVWKDGENGSIKTFTNKGGGVYYLANNGLFDNYILGFGKSTSTFNWDSYHTVDLVYKNNKDVTWNPKSNSDSVTRNTHRYDFNKDGTEENGYVPVQGINNSEIVGVTYKLTDMYAVNESDDNDTSKAVTYDTRAFGTGTNKNVVSMQFGEYATFDKQFTQDSGMRVTQLNQISAPAVVSDNDSRVSGYVDDNTETARTVSKYYNTYTAKTDNVTSKNTDPSRRLYAGIYNGDDVINVAADHVNKMYSSYAADKNYSKNNSTINLQRSSVNGNIRTEFNFRDPTNTSNEYVHLRQVVVNEVKTTDLTLAKTLNYDEQDADTYFEFTVTFKDTFGKSKGNRLINVTGMSYYIYNLNTDGSINFSTADAETVTGAKKSDPDDTTSGINQCTVRCKANQAIVIKDIPVGTQYNVKEKDNNYYTLDSTKSSNIATDNTYTELDVNGTNSAIAVNNRKTGNLEFTKLVKVNNAEFTTNKDFTVVVTLTKPDSSIDMTNYPLKITKDGTNLTDGTDYTKSENGNTIAYTFTKVSAGSSNKISITGIPALMTYSITEGTMSDYTPSYDSDYQGKIRENNDETKSTTITNNRNVGGLQLSKTLKALDDSVLNSDPDNTDFTFEVTITKPGDLSSFNYTGVKVDGNNPVMSGNVITVTMKAGDSKTISGLPYGTTYTINETAFGSYEYKDTVLSDINCAIDSALDTAKIINKVKAPIVMPETGGTPLIYLLPFGIIAIALSGAAMIIYKKKLQGYSLLFGRKRR